MGHWIFNNTQAIKNTPQLYGSNRTIQIESNETPNFGCMTGEKEKNPGKCSQFSLSPSQFSSFSCSVMSDSLWPHGLQHTRLPSPSPAPRTCSNSCPSSQWCHPNHLILCHSLLLMPSILPSIRVFSNESVLHIKWPSIGASALHQSFQWIFKIDFL